MKDDPKEWFIVVDDDDNVLEYRTRYDCHHDRNLMHRAIGVLIYNDKGDILLQKRSTHKDLNPGKYGLSVGGHVTKGQTYEESAQREMEEELGVTLPLQVEKKYITHNQQESHMNMLFSSISNGPFFPNSDEVDMVQFFSKEEIESMKENLTPNCKAALQELHIL